MDTNSTVMGDSISPTDGSTRGGKGALQGLAVNRGLTPAEAFQVEALADEVFRADGVGLKLNLPRPDWNPTAESVPDQVSDLCFYDGGRLVGYSPLDGEGDELEVTAAVLLSHRRRGLFRLLLDAARREAQRRGARRLLLVNYPASVSGGAAVKALGLPYIWSEYRMEAEATTLPPLDPGRLRLVNVGETNVTDLARLMGLTFGQHWPDVSLTERLRETGARYFFAEVDGARIGQIGVVDGEDSIYVRGVGIIPEQRRRGHGRHLLAATLLTMLAEGHRYFALDVATDNPQALSLYRSCGFRETEAYDYHDVPLA